MRYLGVIVGVFALLFVARMQLERQKMVFEQMDLEREGFVLGPDDMIVEKWDLADSVRDESGDVIYAEPGYVFLRMECSIFVGLSSISLSQLKVVEGDYSEESSNKVLFPKSDADGERYSLIYQINGEGFIIQGPLGSAPGNRVRMVFEIPQTAKNVSLVADDVSWGPFQLR